MQLFLASYSLREVEKKFSFMKKFFILSIGACLSLLSWSQITVTGGFTPSNLVNNVLLGNGVTASNITYNTSAANANAVQSNVAFFNAAGTNFPLSSGVLLTTGLATAAAGPNNSTSFTAGGTPMVSSDVDLNAIAAGSVTNGAVLEFDFVPSGDTVRFRYVFGSEEYPEFSPSSFNDAFGFFLSGPNPAGGSYASQNIALIPGTTTPVTINNVGDASNTQYYVFNDNGSTYGTAIQYDGTTVVLTAIAAVQCGQTYHIKLAICNVGDQSYDSGVFIEADSFSSEAVDIAVATVTGDTSVVEGCTNAQFIFTRPTSQANDTLIVNYTIGGDAVMGVDYNNLVNPVVFLPGEDTVIITLNPTQDGINDSPESVIITAMTVTPCNDTIVTTGTLWILDGPIIDVVGINALVHCATDSVLVSASASGGYAPYTYTWDLNNQTGDTAYASISQNGTIDLIVTATDQCGFTGVDTVQVTMNQTLAVDIIDSVPSAPCLPTGVVFGTVIGQTGQPLYHWEGPGIGGTFQIDASVMQNIPPGTYYFTVQDNVCSVFDSIVVTQTLPPVASFTTNVLSGCTPLDVTITNTSQNANNFSWNFGNGNTYTSGDSLLVTTQTYTNNGTITLIASDGTCSDTTTASITLSICGCTNPIALNYNPLATVDDGSCILPTPTVETPNIFTPNGDGFNDTFFLNTTNASSTMLRITNRWGQTVFEMDSANPEWDGKINGTEASEGVYFYQYIVRGVAGDELEGHGFLELSK